MTTTPTTREQIEHVLWKNIAGNDHEGQVYPMKKDLLDDLLSLISTNFISRERVEEIELVPITHEKWCDALPEGLRCNCGQSEAFWLQKEIRALLEDRAISK